MLFHVIIYFLIYTSARYDNTRVRLLGMTQDSSDVTSLELGAREYNDVDIPSHDHVLHRRQQAGQMNMNVLCTSE